MSTLISQRAQRIEASVTMVISTKAKEMKAQGMDVISLSVGEPDFDTPQHIKEAANRAIAQGFTKYTSATGTPELKKAICAKLQRDNGLSYGPSQIAVGCGAKHSIFDALLVLVDEGDEVLIPAPYWVSYPEQVKIAGGKPVIVEPDHGLKVMPDVLKAAITDRSKVLILNSPSNPSGVVYSKEELEELADVVLGAELVVLADEIYEKLVYNGVVHYSISALREGMMERTVVINGVSKAYAMTGWRIGYAAGPTAIISAMGKIQSQETSNPCSISQAAALAALTGPQDSVPVMVKAFDERRRYMVDRLNGMEGVSCPAPQGAFYAFPDVSAWYGSRYNGKVIGGSVDLCTFLLEEMKVACVPGAGFGMDAHIRLSYATSMEHIERAMDRMEEGLEKLRR